MRMENAFPMEKAAGFPAAFNSSSKLAQNLRPNLTQPAALSWPATLPWFMP